MKPRETFFWLTGALAVGAFFRFFDLGRATMGADVMEFYKIAEAGVSPFRLFMENEKWLNTLPPFWFAVHNAFLQFFRLPVTFMTIRLPDAFTGLMVIPAAFCALRAWRGNRIGLLAAWFVALQPLHIQMSRECYFYVPMTLGWFLGFWSIIRMAAREQRNESPDIVTFSLFFTGVFLCTHVQISSWPFAAVLMLTGLVIVLRASIKKNHPWKPVLILIGGCALIGFPTLLSTWGVRDILSLLFGEHREQWQTVFAGPQQKLGETIWSVFSGYLFGHRGLRAIVSLLLPIAGIIALSRQACKRDAVNLAATGYLLGTSLSLAIILILSIFPHSPRHYATLFPLLTVLTVAGWESIAARAWSLRLPNHEKRWVGPVGILLFLFLHLHPAWLSTRLTGHPPYTDVAAWADEHLPPGTVVLCDRWFTPWNEFRINPSRHVLYTFTIPNEPLEVFERHQWRATAKAFFQQHPRAAFFEGKQYWHLAGPWDWPARHFARRQVFADDAGRALDALGLHYRPRPHYLPPEWWEVTLYYNTEEDLVETARADGLTVLALPGEGWSYAKTEDFRDWHLLSGPATVVVYNLEKKPVEAALSLRAAAAGAAQTLRLAGAAPGSFPANELTEASLGPIVLQPGRNERTLTLSRPGTALLVERLDAAPLPPTPHE